MASCRSRRSRSGLCDTCYPSPQRPRVRVVVGPFVVRAKREMESRRPETGNENVEWNSNGRRGLEPTERCGRKSRIYQRKPPRTARDHRQLCPRGHNFESQEIDVRRSTTTSATRGRSCEAEARPCSRNSWMRKCPASSTSRRSSNRSRSASPRSNCPRRRHRPRRRTRRRADRH